LSQHWLNAQFVHRGNQAANVVTQHLAQDLILGRSFRLAPHRIPEFRLNHADGRFDVGTAMIVGKELISLEHEIVEHFAEQPTSAARGASFEGDERHGS